MRRAVGVRGLALLGALALLAQGCGESSHPEMSVEAALGPAVGAAPSAPAPPALEPVEAPVEPRAAQSECDASLAVSSVSGAGRIVILQDRTTWEVDQIDRIDTRHWSRRERILLCGDKMTNLSRGDEVKVDRIH